MGKRNLSENQKNFPKKGTLSPWARYVKPFFSWRFVIFQNICFPFSFAFALFLLLFHYNPRGRKLQPVIEGKITHPVKQKRNKNIKKIYTFFILISSLNGSFPVEHCQFPHTKQALTREAYCFCALPISLHLIFPVNYPRILRE